MLDGVTVLKQSKIKYNDNGIFIAAIIIFVGLIFISTALWTLCFSNGSLVIPATIITALTIMAGFFSYFNYDVTAKYYYIYVVTIDDNVRFNDFNNTFTVLDQNEKVFLIRYKEF